MGAREVMSCLCDLDFLFERILCTLCVCVCVCVCVCKIHVDRSYYILSLMLRVNESS